MKSKAQSDSLRQILNIIFAVTQILASYVLMALHIGNGIGAQSANSATPIIPAGYAFAIWGIIFGLSLIYAIWQLLPKQKENQLLRRVGFLTALAFLANTVWELVAQLVTFSWPTAVIIVGILIPTLIALFRLTEYQSRKALSTAEKILVYAPISILASWVSVATFANISSVMAQLGFQWFTLTGTITAIVFLVLATALALWVLNRTKCNILYVLTIAWAFVAIIIANVTDKPNTTVACITAILTLIVIGFVINKKR